LECLLFEPDDGFLIVKRITIDHEFVQFLKVYYFGEYEIKDHEGRFLFEFRYWVFK